MSACEYCGAVFGTEETGFLPMVRMPCCDRNYHGFCLNFLMESLDQTTCEGCGKVFTAEIAEAIRIAADRRIECAICLKIFYPSDERTQLTTCRHRFHLDCLFAALKVKAACPLCRVPVVVPDEVWQKQKRREVVGALQAFLASGKCPYECRHIVRDVCAREAAASGLRVEPRDVDYSEWNEDKIWEHVLDFLPPRYGIYRKAIYDRFKNAHECSFACEIPPVCARIRWEAANNTSRNQRLINRNGID